MLTYLTYLIAQAKFPSKNWKTVFWVWQILSKFNGPWFQCQAFRKQLKGKLLRNQSEIIFSRTTRFALFSSLKTLLMQIIIFFYFDINLRLPTNYQYCYHSNKNNFTDNQESLKLQFTNFIIERDNYTYLIVLKVLQNLYLW